MKERFVFKHPEGDKENVEGKVCVNNTYHNQNMKNLKFTDKELEDYNLSRTKVSLVGSINANVKLNSDLHTVASSVLVPTKDGIKKGAIPEAQLVIPLYEQKEISRSSFSKK